MITHMSCQEHKYQNSNPCVKVTRWLSVCVCVAKDFANHLTDIFLFYDEDSYLGPKPHFLQRI